MSLKIGCSKQLPEFVDSRNTGDSKVAARAAVVPAGPVTVTLSRMTATVTEVPCSAVLNSLPAAQWPVKDQGILPRGVAGF